VLYALGDPQSFVLLVLAFVASGTVAGWLSALACSRLGLREPGRRAPDPRRQLDPFGSVGAAIAGIGWARPIEVPQQRRGAGVALAVLTGPVVVLLFGLAALAGFGAAYGPVPAAATLLQNGVPGLPFAERAWFLGGLMATYVGALSLVPLPPLPGGFAMFALAPHTSGWQKAHFQLVERNIGTAVLLALLLIPLGSSVALLPRVLDSFLDPLVRAVSGGS
jgi:hypothetical protein